MVEKIMSPSFSFTGWEILEFIKGRKKTLVTLIGAGVGYLLQDNAVGLVIGGAIVESGFALAEFWYKKYSI